MKLTLLQKITLDLIFIDIVLAPLYVLRWSYFGSLPTTLLETLLILTFAFWFIGKLLARDFAFPKSRFDLPIVLFFIAATVSIFASSDWFAGLGRWRAFIFEPIVFYYLLIDVSRFVDRAKLKNILTLAVVAAGGWLALLGIAQFFFHILIVTPDQFDRAHAVYNIGNQLAHVLGPVILLLLAVNLPRRLGQIAIPLTLILLVAFYATDSTGGLLGLTAGVAVLIFVKHFKDELAPKVIQFGIIASTIAFIVFLTQIGHFVPKVENPWIRPGGTDQVRLCLWEGTFNLVKDRPILGAGIEGFSRLYGQSYYTCDGEPFEDTDNIILNFWTKTGLFGLIAMIWLLVMLFKRSDENTLPFQLAFIYWFVHGMVDVPYFKNDLALYWWVFVALVAFSLPRNDTAPIAEPNSK